MTTSEECDLCHMPGMVCSHGAAGLTRAMSMFTGEEEEVQEEEEASRRRATGLHEFQFFGSGGADSWLVNGPSLGAATAAVSSEPPGFRYVDFLRDTCEPGRLTLDASSSVPTISSDSTPRSPEKQASTAAKVAGELPLVPFFGDGAITMNSLDMTAKEAEKPMVGVECEANAMDREARVLRYREKKKRRKFEKQIRYASRKAYAETRPRVKGRFAKVPTEVTTQPPMPAASCTPHHQLNMGWYQYQHQP